MTLGPAIFIAALLLLGCCSALRSTDAIKSDLMACIRRTSSPRRDAEALVSELEASSLANRPSLAPDNWARMNGLWELLFSNRATSLPSSLRDGEGSSWGGVLSALQLAQIDKVYQNIHLSASSSEVQHILALKGGMFVGGTRAKVVLQHEAEVTSNADPAQMAIYLKELRVSVGGTALPALPVLPYNVNKLLTAGLFDVSYLDDDLRVSRGAFGEVRIFTRAREGEGDAL